MNSCVTSIFIVAHYLDRTKPKNNSPIAQQHIHSVGEAISDTAMSKFGAIKAKFGTPILGAFLRPPTQVTIEPLMLVDTVATAVIIPKPH
jgi:hypothetical protein